MRFYRVLPRRHLSDPQNALTGGVTTVTIEPIEERRVAHSVKIRLSVLRKGKVAAVVSNKTLGQWLEEAIAEKIKREQKLNEEVQR